MHQGTAHTATDVARAALSLRLSANPLLDTSFPAPAPRLGQVMQVVERLDGGRWVQDSEHGNPNFAQDRASQLRRDRVQARVVPLMRSPASRGAGASFGFAFA